MQDHDSPRISIVCASCGEERVIQDSVSGNNLRYYEQNKEECQHCMENKNVKTTTILTDL